MSKKQDSVEIVGSAMTIWRTEVAGCTGVLSVLSFFPSESLIHSQDQSRW
jgi:hypothetical protein